MNRFRSLSHLGILLGLTLVLAGCASKSDNKTTAPPAFTFTSDRMPLGLVAENYSEVLGVDGGTPPFTFTVDGADLPPGLSDKGLSADDRGLSADDKGQINGFALSGMPTTAGIYTFTVSATDAEDRKHSDEVTIQVVADFDPVGSWSYHTLVTLANDACDGEAGDETTFEVTIERVGNTVTLKGLLGDPDNEVTGSWFSNRMNMSGTYPEGDGMTTGTHDLVIYTPDLIQGIEYWNWVGNSGGTCPGSLSRVTGTRVVMP